MMMLIGLIFQVFLLVERISSKEFVTLSCDYPEYCRCDRDTLDCFFTDIVFDMTSNVELAEDISTLLIHGSNYSVEIPEKVYTESWSQIRHLKIKESRGNLTLPFAFTKKLSNLRTLTIRNSNLSAIDSYVFSSMRQIIEIDISNNSFLNIKEVEKGLQNFNSNILILFNMSAIHNAEQMHQFTLTRDLFYPSSSVKILDISWTRAFWLDASFDLMPNLTSFNMSGTFIVGPTDCFATLNRLHKIETCAMDHWPTLARNGDVSFLQYNHYIVRRESVNCPPTSFKDNSTGCIILPLSAKRIYMRYVQSSSFFLSFEKGFCILNNSVELFTIRGLKISEPASAIYGLHKLKVFDLSYIGIHFKTDFIRDMPALETFLSPGNNLNKIESTPDFGTIFTNNKNLKRIDFSENELSYIPSNMFTSNPLLEVIDLSKNILTHIKLNLSVNVHLIEIDLHQNKLKTIDEMLITQLDYFFDDTQSAIDINLTENDLICNCDNIKFVKWILNTKNNVHESASLLCRNSASEATHIMELDIEQIESSCFQIEKDTSFVIYIAFSVTVITVVVFVLVSVCLYRRRKYCFHKKPRKQPVGCPVFENQVDTFSHPSANLEEVRSSDSPDTFVLISNGPTSRCYRKPQYTVFIAYCHEDKDFVVNKLYGALEKYLREYLPDRNQDTLTLLYDKNFLPGEDLVEICKAAVYNSYVTVAIVSDSFLNSRWCSYEMQTAFEAEIPIIPVYLGKCQDENLCGILKLIYDSKVRLLWPEATTLYLDSLSQDEMDLIRCLATSITTYVKKYDSKTVNS